MKYALLVDLACLTLWLTILPCAGDEKSGDDRQVQILKRGPTQEVLGKLDLDQGSSLAVTRTDEGLVSIRVEQAGEPLVGMLEETELIYSLAYDNKEKRAVCIVNQARNFGQYYSGLIVIEKNVKTGRWEAFRCFSAKDLGASGNRDVWIEATDFSEKKGVVRMKMAVEEFKSGVSQGGVKRSWESKDLSKLKNRQPLKKCEEAELQKERSGSELESETTGDSPSE